MRTKTAIGIMAAFITVAAVAAVAAAPYLPDRIATHWNLQGVADGYSSKAVGLALTPLLMAFVAVLGMGLPWFDKRHGLGAFRPKYDAFFVFFEAFLLYLFWLMLYWDLGGRFDFGQLLAPAIGLLLIVVGALMRDAPQNRLFGIRTPWTLASELSWRKTHAIGSAMFVATGAATAILGLLAGGAIAFSVLIAMLVATTVISVICSIAFARQK